MSLDLTQVGARPREALVSLGIYLPNIQAGAGYELSALVIHERDQFHPERPAVELALEYAGGPLDLWRCTFSPAEVAPSHGAGSFGQPGSYHYRYRLKKNGQVVVPAFTDPFAQRSGPGAQSAFVFPPLQPFGWEDAEFRVPEISELIVYELMVDEFRRDFDGVRRQLDYLQGLSVNCIELMPVTNVLEPFRWGYMPLNYFAVEERYGSKEALQRLVNECHKRGIAVIHDAVYAHAHADFAYYRVYEKAGVANPMMGPFTGDLFGHGPDFNKAFAREYFAAVNCYFLEELHCDGFRYDYVPGYYDGPAGKGYAKLVFDTYQRTKSVPRFSADGGRRSRVIQAAEHLELAKEVLEVTHTNLSKRWDPMLKALEMASHEGWVHPFFAHDLLLIDLEDPWPVRHEGHDPFPVAPLQFLETHDKPRLMYRVTGGEKRPDAAGFDLFGRSREPWYRLQPFAIALMTCEGVPLLWQGQEFGEFYGLPDDGGARVLAGRPLHWEFFYEEGGRALVRLYRTLGQLRRGHQALRSRRSFFFNAESRAHEGLIAFQRDPDQARDASFLVLANFSSGAQSITLPARRAGTATELLNHLATPALAETHELVAGQSLTVEVPSHYGKIFRIE